MSNAEILAQLEADLALYVAARAKSLNGEDVSIGPNHVRRTPIAVIEQRIRELRFDIQRLKDGVSHSTTVFSHR